MDQLTCERPRSSEVSFVTKDNPKPGRSRSPHQGVPLVRSVVFPTRVDVNASLLLVSPRHLPWTWGETPSDESFTGGTSRCFRCPSLPVPVRQSGRSFGPEWASGSVRPDVSVGPLLWLSEAAPWSRAHLRVSVRVRTRARVQTILNVHVESVVRSRSPVTDRVSSTSHSRATHYLDSFEEFPSPVPQNKTVGPITRHRARAE